VVQVELNSVEDAEGEKVVTALQVDVDKDVKRTGRESHAGPGDRPCLIALAVERREFLDRSAAGHTA
jgi:hypothetical protein